MISENKENDNNNNNNEKADLEKVVLDASSLLNLFQNIKLKAESNLNCKFFLYLDKSSISKLILPYLEMKDLMNLRSTCRDLNSTVNSLTTLTILRKQLIKKLKKDRKPPKIDMNLLNSNELPESENNEDVKIQLESLNNIKNFLKEKLFESEKIIKVYRNDIEYLKNESKSQDDVINRLNETYTQLKEKNDEILKENIELKSNFENVNKKFNENNQQNSKIIDDLKKEIEVLKIDKNKLTVAVVQLKKMTDELKKKNISKSEALKAIKSFFINSTLLNLKSIPGFNDKEIADEKDKTLNNNK